jgi:mono/diheme cytochrome c family protein
VVLEDDESVKVVENPLIKSDAKTIYKESIDDRTHSNVSAMPKGLLDTLTRNEILDLIAYVFAKGDPKHPIFAGGDPNAHGH